MTQEIFLIQVFAPNTTLDVPFCIILHKFVQEHCVNLHQNLTQETGTSFLNVWQGYYYIILTAMTTV